MPSKFKLFTQVSSILISCVLLGASCAPSSQQGGMYLSIDQGSSWTPSNQVGGEESSQTLARETIIDVRLDRRQNGLVYIATSSGIFRSETAAQNWEQITTTGQVQTFDLSPANLLHLVAARSNQIYYTKDRGETWQLVYTHPTQVMITDLVIHPKTPSIIYAALASGELLVTKDSGQTWSPLHNFHDPILSINVHQSRPDQLYALTVENGLYRSDDKGTTWQEISNSLTSTFDRYTSRIRYKQLLQHPNNLNKLILLTSNGVYFSNDSGSNWQPLSLLNEADQQLVNVIAWDPQNEQRVFYATPTVIFRSDNFGESWQTTPFTAGLTISSLQIDPNQTTRIYLGTSRK